MFSDRKIWTASILEEIVERFCNGIRGSSLPVRFVESGSPENSIGKVGGFMAVEITRGGDDFNWIVAAFDLNVGLSQRQKEVGTAFKMTPFWVSELWTNTDGLDIHFFN